MVSKILDLGFYPFDRCLPGASSGLSTQNPEPRTHPWGASRPVGETKPEKTCATKCCGVIHTQGRAGRGVAAGLHSHTLIWILTPPLPYCVTLGK